MVQILLLLIDAVLINLGFLASFLIRYGIPFPSYNFLPFQRSFLFLTLIHISALSFFGVYRDRLKSSWDLFRRTFLGLLWGTLLSIALVYVFRAKWGAFPTSVFVLSFFINLFLVFKLNRHILKANKKIRKKVVIIGEDDMGEIVGKKADVERKSTDEIGDLLKCTDADVIVICDKIRDERDLSLLIYLVQKLKMDVVFGLSTYMELLRDRVNGENSPDFLNTLFGRKADIDEFLMRSLDIIGSLAILFVCAPVMFLISLLIKITSPGPVFYRQQRMGKDGKVFTLYKFRTMVKDAERISGLSPTTKDDPRVTRIGSLLRRIRLDELPQLFNVIRGDMGLVGPRPENLYRVENHKGLQGLRLAVKPGITGLAQIRSLYDLKPQHKIKYDYLYIQRRSLLLNLYILLKTIPVVLLGKGR